MHCLWLGSLIPAREMWPPRGAGISDPSHNISVLFYKPGSPIPVTTNGLPPHTPSHAHDRSLEDEDEEEQELEADASVATHPAPPARPRASQSALETDCN